MKITPHFSLSEFSRSSTAEFLHIRNSIPDSVIPNIKRLCSVLEHARSIIGCPIIISSGYRCEKLNSVVGGSPKSYHRLGRAADLYPANGDLDNLFFVLQSLPHVELIRYHTFIHFAV